MPAVSGHVELAGGIRMNRMFEKYRGEKFIVGQLTGGGKTRKQLFCRKKPTLEHTPTLSGRYGKFVLNFLIEFDITVLSRFSGSQFQ